MAWTKPTFRIFNRIEYVDITTGEMIKAFHIKNKTYRRIKKEEGFEVCKNKEYTYGLKTTLWWVEPHEQLKLEL